MTTLSKNLRYLMNTKYLSEIDVARLAQIPQPTIHHILAGFTKKPRRKTLEAIANALSVSINDLTGLEKPILLQKTSSDEKLITEIKKLRKEIAALNIGLRKKLLIHSSLS